MHLEVWPCETGSPLNGKSNANEAFRDRLLRSYQLCAWPFHTMALWMNFFPTRRKLLKGIHRIIWAARQISYKRSWFGWIKIYCSPLASMSVEWFEQWWMLLNISTITACFVSELFLCLTFHITFPHEFYMRARTKCDWFWNNDLQNFMQNLTEQNPHCAYSAD